MADQYVQINPDSTGKKIDVAELTVNSATVERQRMVIGDNATAGNYAKIDASGNLQTLAIATSSALTNVTAATASTTLLAANSVRKGASFFNDSTANLYLGFTASAVSTTSYTVKIPAAGFFEMPLPVWTGQITGVWDAVNGTLRITELS